MIERALNAFLSEPALIPAYLFMGFLVSFLVWEIIKFIIFIIRYSGDSKK